MTTAKIKNNAITTAKVKNNAITGAKVKDFSLTPADSGILFAQVNDDGSVTRASKGVKVNRLDTGEYEVIFSRVVSNGTFIATAVKQDWGTTPNAIVSLADRGDVKRGVHVRTRNDAGAATDCPFHLVVIL